MPRSTNAVASRRRKNRVLNMTEGFKGGRSRLYKPATEALCKSLVYTFAHRRKKKGDFRGIWIARINAAVHQRGLSYSKFIHALDKAKITINRKFLADMAVNDVAGFDAIVAQAKAALA